MTSVWVGSGSVFYCFSLNLRSAAQFVFFKRSENDLKRQSVTEPEPMPSPINYPAYSTLLLANPALGNFLRPCLESITLHYCLLTVLKSRNSSGKTTRCDTFI